jgi:uncharacterized protein YndB with AHSA1/START domain
VTDPVDAMAVEVRATIPGSVEQVFARISDVERMAGLGPEHVEARWDAGPRPDPDAMLGATFSGRNVRVGREWTMPCRVTRYEPPVAFAWEVGDPQCPTATWSYELTAEAGQRTALVHRFRHGPGWSYLRSICERHPDRVDQLISGRAAELQANMQAALDGLGQQLTAERADSTG